MVLGLPLMQSWISEMVCRMSHSKKRKYALEEKDVTVEKRSANDALFLVTKTTSSGIDS